MASITISELRPTGYELFSDSETFMTDLVDSELDIMGGRAAGGLAAASGCNSGFLCCITRAEVADALVITRAEVADALVL
ncbi:hypothetical protein LC653_21215 [Nostoc sp. CHAB 5784]|uniref:hypothetical protein n=1 Tax=Nostoc mirabile TaxID=2907820 RepID=UPI001E4B5572|nr:hypothetical protein [Nostoc mirabile]MCC5666368.1 hypothetical protein [Nostoc mirabile CHAB5784]